MNDDYKRSIVGLALKGHSTSSIANMIHTEEIPVTKNAVVGVLSRISPEKKEQIRQDIESGRKPELYRKHENVPVLKKKVGKPKKIDLTPYTDEIKELYKKTQKPKEIARDLNQKYPNLNAQEVYVRNHIRRIGIQRTPGEATKILSSDKEKELYDRLKRGEKPADLSSEYNLSPRTIVNKAQKQKIKIFKILRIRKRPVWTPEKIKSHDKLVSQGLESDSIAERLGVTKDALKHFRKSTGRVRKQEKLTPAIIDKIKKIRLVKITYKRPNSKNSTEVYPGEKTIKRELFRQTGKVISGSKIRELIKTIKEERKMIKTLNESRIKTILGMFSRKSSNADRIEHARHAYKIINMADERLTKQLKGAHPDVQKILEYLKGHHKDALQMLNKMGAGEDPMKVKKSKEQERM